MAAVSHGNFSGKIVGGGSVPQNSLKILPQMHIFLLYFLSLCFAVRFHDMDVLPFELSEAHIWLWHPIPENTLKLLCFNSLL